MPENNVIVLNCTIVQMCIIKHFFNFLFTENLADRQGDVGGESELLHAIMI